jgi:uroporphyrinogen-III synthase
MSHSLAEKRILITREKAQARKLIQLVRDTGAIPCVAPMIRFEPIPLTTMKKEYMELSKQQWLFFTSANTVRFFNQDIKKLGIEVPHLIASVGEKTTKALLNLGYKVDFQPSIFQGSVMVEEFVQRYGTSINVTIVSGESAREEIPSLLTKYSVPFTQLKIYRTIENKESERLLNSHLKTGIDICFFTSPSTVHACVQLAKNMYLNKLKETCLCIAIGETTATSLLECGFKKVTYPKKYTMEEMVECAKKYVEEGV